MDCTSTSRYHESMYEWSWESDHGEIFPALDTCIQFHAHTRALTAKNRCHFVWVLSSRIDYEQYAQGSPGVKSVDLRHVRRTQTPSNLGDVVLEARWASPQPLNPLQFPTVPLATSHPEVSVVVPSLQKMQLATDTPMQLHASECWQSLVSCTQPGMRQLVAL